MAREARERDLYGIYHISQSGSRNRDIFRSEEDRQLFIDGLTEAKKQFRFTLIAYCLIDPQRYHLIIRLEGCDISQLMASLNIRYTRQLNQPAGLFRDRFRSELLETTEELQAVLRSLRVKSKESTRWNSFCRVDQRIGTTNALGIKQVTNETIVDLFQGASCGDPDHPCLTTEAELLAQLEEMAVAEGLTLAKALDNKDLRNNWILQARRNTTLTLREIGQVFGGLSESMVSKIIKDSLKGSLHA